MSATREPAGRQALAAKLGELQGELSALGAREKSQKAAVEEANRRRRRVAGRAEDEPWPRGESGADLSLQAVNGWFPKRKGSKNLSVPQDFEDLWAVVVVMLEWTGRIRKGRSAERLRHAWKQLHADAQRPISLDPEVHGYLEAARRAAEQHPYPGLSSRNTTPSLTEVYVRQLGRREVGKGHAATGQDMAGLTVSAEEIFRGTDSLSVLVAGPGVGKSTLLRTRLRVAAGEWLDSTQAGRSPAPAVPIWVSARALAGEETQLPDALTAATRRLSRHGRFPELDRTCFLERPCTGARWHLLVDGLDELPNAHERRAVLEKLANAVAGEPPLYRCVVATRPLTDNELDILGDATPRYELQPFASEDLSAYVEKYFTTRWPQEEAVRRAHRFTEALQASSLHELASTPLMAFMLCQLHLTDPELPLPEGRSAVYERFTDLLYEKNQGKKVADSHEEAIQHLVQSLQSPRARQEADSAARKVHAHLPELIDYLAHRWRTERHTPVAEVLASHEAVVRPRKVHSELWAAFLEDLLQHTGLLVHHVHGLGFPHQTFLEYHAARHATRDEQASADLLDEMFPPGRAQLQVPDTESSYLGFLLDGILTCSDRLENKAINAIETLTQQGGEPARLFLTSQIALRTNLPSASTARQLTRFANDASCDAERRVDAAYCLVEVPGHQNAGADLLSDLTCDTTLSDFGRVYAAASLTTLEGRQGEGAGLLTAFTHDTTLRDPARVYAARWLTRVEGHQDAGAHFLTVLTRDTTLRDFDRLYAADGLIEAEGWREAGADLLTTLAEDTTLHDSGRVNAAKALAQVEGYRETGAGLLIALTEDTTLRDSGRLSAANALSEVEGHLETAADVLIALAEDTTLHDCDRLSAANVLVELEGCRGTGVDLLTALTRDTTLYDYYRVSAANVLAGLEGWRETGAELLSALAVGTSLHGSGRVKAAHALARMEKHRDEGADLLFALADDTTCQGFVRVYAAQVLAEVEGSRRSGSRLLSTLADDATLGHDDRVKAAHALTRMRGSEKVNGGA
ncbi:NACHT domain-containing protein [Streptomyces globisporus]|uniref:NACHT domain-containing protein n=1 Tax=Streptomyces TaxID=1883 RepID=UPI000D1CDD89|nr:NACHT domain-containing protein [Streptomyces sp. st170]WSU85567.1 NACHT domain-containing protein [Streptomyces globisporus]